MLEARATCDKTTPNLPLRDLMQTSRSSHTPCMVKHNLNPKRKPNNMELTQLTMVREESLLPRSLE